MSDRQILCYGDSNTWGHIPVTGERYPRHVRWPGVMRERLGPGFHIVEEGQCGRTTVWDDPLEGGTKNGLSYLPACLESHRPLDLVILMLGTNDLKARFSLSAMDIALGVEQLIGTIRKSECGVGGQAPAILLAAPPPVQMNDGLADVLAGAGEKSLLFAQRYAELAERTGCAYIDLGRIIAVDPADGVHYSAETHQRLGEAFAERVLAIISDPLRPSHE